MINTFLAYSAEPEGKPKVYFSSGTSYTSDTLELKICNLTLKDVLYLIQWLINHSMQDIS